MIRKDAVGQRSPTILALGTGFMEDNFSTDGGGGGGGRGDGSGSNASYGERCGAADETLLICPPLTSCCAAGLLTGRGPVLVHGLGVGDPWCRRQEGIMLRAEELI